MNLLIKKNNSYLKILDNIFNKPYLENKKINSNLKIFDNIFNEAYIQNKDFFDKHVNFSILSNDMNKEYLNFYYVYDGFIYESVIIKRNIKDRFMIEIKLGNHGFFYTKLDEYKKIDNTDWNGYDNWYTLNNMQISLFDKINDFIKLIIAKQIFHFQSEILIDMRYNHKHDNFYIIIDDGYYYIQISFENNYSLCSTFDSRNRNSYSDIQKISKL